MDFDAEDDDGDFGQADLVEFLTRLLDATHEATLVALNMVAEGDSEYVATATVLDVLDDAEVSDPVRELMAAHVGRSVASLSRIGNIGGQHA